VNFIIEFASFYDFLMNDEQFYPVSTPNVRDCYLRYLLTVGVTLLKWVNNRSRPHDVTGCPVRQWGSGGQFLESNRHGVLTIEIVCKVDN